MKAGIPHGSVPGPVHYAIYTADMPIKEDITTATYADDTASIAYNSNLTEGSRILQRHLDVISNWFKTGTFASIRKNQPMLHLLCEKAIVQVYILTDNKFRIRIMQNTLEWT